MTVRVDSFPPAEALDLATAHSGLHGHRVTVHACECGQPIGITCDDCRDFVVAVDTGCSLGRAGAG